MPWDRLDFQAWCFCCWWRPGVCGLLSNKCVTRLLGCLFAYLHCSWMCLYARVFFQRSIIRKKCIPKFQQLDLDAAQLASYNQTCTHARTHLRWSLAWNDSAVHTRYERSLVPAVYSAWPVSICVALLSCCCKKMYQFVVAHPHGLLKLQNKAAIAEKLVCQSWSSVFTSAI